MRKQTKNINTPYAWLIGLLLFAHGLTPHHHHFDSVYDHLQHPVQQENHAEDNPLHCHAFNDLILDTEISANNISLKEITAVLLVEEDFYLRAKNITESTDVSQKNDIPTDEVFLSESPTRGSPLSI